MAAVAFIPNNEQAVALASTAHRLLVRAKAGTGKTALLIEHARRNPHLRLLYVTFGKANQEDAAARFPRNVTTKTSHGLAWEVGGQFKKTGKQGDLFPSQLAKAYGIPMAFARHLRETLHNFMVSADSTASGMSMSPARSAAMAPGPPPLVMMARRLPCGLNLEASAFEA